MTFDIIVAADLDWGIGKASGLPWPKLRADLAHFRRITSEDPRGSPQRGRDGAQDLAEHRGRGQAVAAAVEHLVVSREGIAGPAPEGAVFVRSFDDALAAAGDAPAIAEVFVVGGAQLYRVALADARLRWVYLTRIDGRFACDTHLPDLDAAGFRAVAWDGAAAHEDNGVRLSDRAAHTATANLMNGCGA